MGLIGKIGSWIDDNVTQPVLTGAGKLASAAIGAVTSSPGALAAAGTAIGGPLGGVVASFAGNLLNPKSSATDTFAGRSAKGGGDKGTSIAHNTSDDNVTQTLNLLT